MTEEHSTKNGLRAACRHYMVEDRTNHPYWRSRCSICGLRSRVIPPGGRQS